MLTTFGELKVGDLFLWRVTGDSRWDSNLCVKSSPTTKRVLYYFNDNRPLRKDVTVYRIDPRHLGMKFRDELNERGIR